MSEKKRLTQASLCVKISLSAYSSTRFSRAIAEVKMTLAVSENRQTLVQGVNNDVAALPVNDVEMASIDDEDDSESACHTSNQEDFEEFLYSILYKVLLEWKPCSYFRHV